MVMMWSLAVAVPSSAIVVQTSSLPTCQQGPNKQTLLQLVAASKYTCIAKIKSLEREMERNSHW